jgi:hypothetical protein
MEERRKPLSTVSSCCLPYSLERAGRVGPALCPGRGTLRRVSLGQPPFLPRLRGSFRRIVRRVPRYYGAVRLPAVVRHRRGSLDFPMRSALPARADDRRLSRFPCVVFPYMRGVSDRAGSTAASRWRQPRCGLPHQVMCVGTPEWPPFGGLPISRFNTRPARTPVNASSPSLRIATHDSGPVWLARPSPYDSCIHDTSPVFIGAIDLLKADRLKEPVG